MVVTGQYSHVYIYYLGQKWQIPGEQWTTMMWPRVKNDHAGTTNNNHVCWNIVLHASGHDWDNYDTYKTSNNTSTTIECLVIAMHFARI